MKRKQKILITGGTGFLGKRLGLALKEKYDVILANINRNILLADIPTYASNLMANGTLFVSGFYEDDIFAISEKCNSCGLKFEKNLSRNNWVAVKYVF